MNRAVARDYNPRGNFNQASLADFFDLCNNSWPYAPIGQIHVQLLGLRGLIGYEQTETTTVFVVARDRLQSFSLHGGERVLLESAAKSFCEQLENAGGAGSTADVVGRVKSVVVKDRVFLQLVFARI